MEEKSAEMGFKKESGRISPLEDEVPKLKKKKVECVKEVLTGTRKGEAKRKIKQNASNMGRGGSLGIEKEKAKDS